MIDSELNYEEYKELLLNDPYFVGKYVRMYNNVIRNKKDYFAENGYFVNMALIGAVAGVCFCVFIVAKSPIYKVLSILGILAVALIGIWYGNKVVKKFAVEDFFCFHYEDFLRKTVSSDYNHLEHKFHLDFSKLINQIESDVNRIEKNVDTSEDTASLLMDIEQLKEIKKRYQALYGFSCHNYKLAQDHDFSLCLYQHIKPNK